MDKEAVRAFLLTLALILVPALTSCATPAPLPTPTPDVVATQVAQALAVGATLTALAPTATDTPLPSLTPSHTLAASSTPTRAETRTPTRTDTPQRTDTSTPTATATATSSPTPTPPRVSAQVIDAFKKAGLEAEAPRSMIKDDYGLAPMVAEEGTRFLIPSLCDDCGGRVFSFKDQEALDKTKEYYTKLVEVSAIFFSWVFEKDNILVQINGDLPEQKANLYKEALESMP